MGNAYHPRHTIIALTFVLTALAACGESSDTTDSSNENPSVATSGNDAPNGSVNDSDDPASEDSLQPLACATDSFDLDHGNQLFRFIFLYDDKRRLITTETPGLQTTTPGSPRILSTEPTTAPARHGSSATQKFY